MGKEQVIGYGIMLFCGLMALRIVMQMWSDWRYERWASGLDELDVGEGGH